MPSSYPLLKNDPYSYEFLTDQGIRYTAYFLEYSSMFADYPQLAQQIYMFNVETVEGEPDSSYADERIGLTILDILKVLFQRSENVVVYVCDSLDDRQLARKRKFDIWFWKYNDGSLIKEDELAIVDGVEIYNSMIIHKSNKHLKEVILAFKELNERAGEK